MSDILSTQRIDVWLWYGRFYKTRSLATKMVRGGKVRLNGKVCKKTSTPVSAEDVLIFSRADDLLIVKIRAFALRRGPASDAQNLYEDLTPVLEKRETKKVIFTSNRERGAGRPTKNERRAIDRLMNRK
ncbi:MAG: RNA-binding S4 domain-containing protein [Kordiimonadaceae bacterium]|jgi:ribosome-associated heat shock protein Hsp15|nr:RNA-binding S4 domain-containing protein [Kordiimonadaceae bacterium]MBT7604528.1 RNA-binding S4 domain-containing protein [Kordiimonadaceae bacterium]